MNSDYNWLWLRSEIQLDYCGESPVVLISQTQLALGNDAV